jgi:hypothetical protein
MGWTCVPVAGQIGDDRSGASSALHDCERVNDVAEICHDLPQRVDERCEQAPDLPASVDAKAALHVDNLTLGDGSSLILECAV